MTGRKEYIEKITNQLNEWDEKLDSLERKSDSVKIDAKFKYEALVSDIKSKINNQRERLDKIISSGEDAWSELKSGIDKSWDNLEASFKEAKSKF